MEDNLILELYWNRDFSAIDETAKKYGRYCFVISENILCNREDSEECVNDTLLNAWNSIPPHRPQNLCMYLAKICRNVAFNRYNSKSANKRDKGELPLVLDELSECVSTSSDVESQFSAEELGRIVNLFVRSQSLRDRNIFVRRYFFGETVSVIAEKYSMTENHVMVVLSRIRKKLKTYLTKEGYFCE